jgi:hypothetical protein
MKPSPVISITSVESLFRVAVIAILTITAGAKLISLVYGKSAIYVTLDPIFRVNYRSMLASAAIIETIVVGYLIFGRDSSLKHLAVIWISSIFLLYRLGASIVQPGHFCPCLGSMTDWIHTDQATIGVFLGYVAAIMLSGEIFFLVANPNNIRGLPNVITSHGKT